MLRVLHILCDLSGGGAERMVLDLCRYGPHPSEVIAIQAGGALEPSFAAAGVPVRCARRPRRQPGLAALARIARWARSADVVHTHLWAGDLWGRLGAHLRLSGGRPCVVTTEHNTRPDSSLRGRLGTALAPLSDAVVFVSHDAAQAMASPAMRRVEVIENGIDLGRFAPLPLRPASDGRRLLAVGRLTRQKGLDVLLAALARCPDLTLEIAGEGEERPALERQIAALGLGGRVVLRGWVADVRPLLAAADVVVVPSRWEGFGLVAAEAMAAGRPVVASDIPGLREAAGGAAALVAPEDPAALAAVLARVCAQPAELARLRQAGLARAAALDVRQTAARYARLYEALRAAR